MSNEGYGRSVGEIRQRYEVLSRTIGEQGGGDRTIHDIETLLGEIDQLTAVLGAVDRLFSLVMDEENMHVFEPVAARVTAALATAHSAEVQV